MYRFHCDGVKFDQAIHQQLNVRRQRGVNMKTNGISEKSGKGFDAQGFLETSDHFQWRNLEEFFDTSSCDSPKRNYDLKSICIHNDITQYLNEFHSSRIMYTYTHKQ